ncbi:MAG: hypothetical protein KZQ88_18080, partial [Candidatus Thiodiazotropha sp. (ex Dulcina madagascariensis)]|nr:hypothetical protein [Candidatus Thiodiazotropha sp. (ex Dulcina madagascariensis)]MCU7928304.1 hypothetical protein [Candidatus Thiodiazotropha sp. (ex Dulcina madagascariensis)]
NTEPMNTCSFSTCYTRFNSAFTHTLPRRPNIVKAILREVLDVKRITMRDTKSYCGILLDNNNRKPICRLHFNYSQKYLGVFSGKNEERIEIDSIDDIFQHSDRIKAVIAEYEAN